MITYKKFKIKLKFYTLFEIPIIINNKKYIWVFYTPFVPYAHLHDRCQYLVASHGYVLTKNKLNNLSKIKCKLNKIFAFNL